MVIINSQSAKQILDLARNQADKWIPHIPTLPEAVRERGDALLQGAQLTKQDYPIIQRLAFTVLPPLRIPKTQQMMGFFLPRMRHDFQKAFSLSVKLASLPEDDYDDLIKLARFISRADDLAVDYRDFNVTTLRIAHALYIKHYPLTAETMHRVFLQLMHDLYPPGLRGLNSVKKFAFFTLAALLFERDLENINKKMVVRFLFEMNSPEKAIDLTLRIASLSTAKRTLFEKVVLDMVDEPEIAPPEGKKRRGEVSAHSEETDREDSPPPPLEEMRGPLPLSTYAETALFLMARYPHSSNVDIGNSARDIALKLMTRNRFSSLSRKERSRYDTVYQTLLDSHRPVEISVKGGAAGGGGAASSSSSQRASTSITYSHENLCAFAALTLLEEHPEKDISDLECLARDPRYIFPDAESKGRWLILTDQSIHHSLPSDFLPQELGREILSFLKPDPIYDANRFLDLLNREMMTNEEGVLLFFESLDVSGNPFDCRASTASALLKFIDQNKLHNELYKMNQRELLRKCLDGTYTKAIATIDIFSATFESEPPEFWESYSIEKQARIIEEDIERGEYNEQIEALTELSLNGFTLSCLPAFFSRLSNLTTLDLSDNIFRSLPPELAELSNLQVLNIDENMISELPHWVGRLTQLRTLNMQGNELDSLPREIEELSHLETLNLERNEFSEIPDVIFRLSNITHLNFSQNPVSTLSPAVRNLSRLQTLQLSYTNLSALPDELGRCEALREIDLSRNSISNIDIVYTLRALRKLDVSINKIPSISSAIRNLEQLTEFNCAINEITTINDEMCALPHVEKINFHGNRLESLPEGFLEFARRGLREANFRSNSRLEVPLPLKQQLAEIPELRIELP